MKRKLTTVVIGVIIAMMFSQVLVANAEIGHNNSHSSCKCAGEPAITEDLESLINMCKQANGHCRRYRLCDRTASAFGGI